MKRTVRNLLGIWMLLQLTVLPGHAAEGSITVRTAEEQTVSICCVGESRGANYQLLEEFGGGMLSFDDTLSKDLAAWLAKKANGDITRRTEGGTVRFAGLEEGLYLVFQTGDTQNRNAFAPFLVSIPWDGSMWQVEVTPFPEEIPQTGDPIWISLAAMFGSGGMLICIKKKRLTKS